MLIGIVLEKIDAKDKKQEQDKVVAQNTTLSGEIKKIDGQNKELITGNAKVVAQNTKLSEKIKQLDEQNKELIDGQNELIAGKDELIELNKDLSRNLQEKDLKIKELDKKAKMSARNVTSTYDFKGTKRQTSVGRVIAITGEEFGIYMQITAYANAGDFPNLIKLCEEQIEKTPEWYTPFYYLATAQADTGLKDEAIKNMQYVVDNTPGDPEYAKAPEILKMLKQQP